MTGLKITNVHEALATASSEPTTPSYPMDNYSFRMKSEIADKVTEICARHGTSMSEFVRQCCEGLIKDYEGK
jgi:hypothetical protein